MNLPEKTSPQQGTVYFAEVYFADVNQYKRRSVVVVSNEQAIDIDVLTAPVTSEVPRNEFDVVLEYWLEAGLHSQAFDHFSIKITK